MEQSAVKTRRTREITGPTPHSVAIRGKPTLRRPREFLILERRKQEELREEANAVVTYNKQFDLKTTWERTTDRKIERNTVQRRMESLLRQQQFSLEERRDKLRSLLCCEEEQYHSELASKQETVLERQAKMRERAKMLRAKREAERLTVVEKKLDQRWRDQCEELRSTLTKRHQDEVCRERADQLRAKSEQQQRQQQEEELYARLWEEDRKAKCQREEVEAAMQLERNMEMLKVLTLQTSATEKQKEDTKRLKEQEAELLREETSLRALEEEQMRREKIERQAATRKDLDYSLKLKMKKRAREEQEELAMDMQILDTMLKETTNEAMQHLQRKNELREEIQRYREYLSEQAVEERRREAELDAVVTAEVEKQWAKRREAWQREREARKQLMADVLKARRKQIEEKLAKIAEEKAEAEKEREALQLNCEQHQQLERQQHETGRKRQLSHQDNLREQIGYQQRVREREAERERWEIGLAREEEELYRQRVQGALAHPSPDKAHPRRLAGFGARPSFGVVGGALQH